MNDEVKENMNNLSVMSEQMDKLNNAFDTLFNGLQNQIEQVELEQKSYFERLARRMQDYEPQLLGGRLIDQLEDRWRQEKEKQEKQIARSETVRKVLDLLRANDYTFTQ